MSSDLRLYSFYSHNMECFGCLWGEESYEGNDHAVNNGRIKCPLRPQDSSELIPVLHSASCQVLNLLPGKSSIWLFSPHERRDILLIYIMCISLHIRAHCTLFWCRPCVLQSVVLRWRIQGFSKAVLLLIPNFCSPVLFRLTEIKIDNFVGLNRWWLFFKLLCNEIIQKLKKCVLWCFTGISTINKTSRTNWI